jgi:putative oxidoreductase
MLVKVIDYAARTAIAFILLQTLWFKFRAAPESVEIFSALHAEPWGRIFAGTMELAASLLLIHPRTVVYGAGLALGTMFGAILSHVFVIGIAVRGDSGLLFGLAVAVALLSVICIYIRRGEAASALAALKSRVSRT